MRDAIQRHLAAIVLAVGLLMGVGQPPAQAAAAAPAAMVQTVQYYGPGYYRGPPPGYYGRRFYGPGPGFYGPRPGFYGRGPGFYGRGPGFYGRGPYGRGPYGRRFYR